MKTMKEIGKITKSAFRQGISNWLIWVVVGAILYAFTKQLFWLIFGISFGMVFSKDDFFGKKDKKKGQEES